MQCSQQVQDFAERLKVNKAFRVVVEDFSQFNGLAWENIRKDFDCLGYIAASNYELIYNPSQSFGTISIPMSVFPINSALDAMYSIAGNGWGAGAGQLHFQDF